MITDNKIKEIIEHLSEYIDAKRDMLILNSADKMKTVLYTILIGVLIVLFGFVILLTLSISFSLMIGQLIGNLALGFLLSALIFIVLLIGIIWLSKGVIKSMVDAKINDMLD